LLTRQVFSAARRSTAGTVALLAGVAVVCAGVLVAGTTRPACAGDCALPAFDVTPQAYSKFASQATGMRFARGLFAGVALPAGARPVAAPPELRIPPGWGIAPTSDVGRVWRVPLPATDVARFFARHPPRGTAISTPGAGVSAITVSALYYNATAVPAALTSGQVVIVVDPAGPGRTFVRIDAQVVL
jgi:hypothetical protein